MNERIKELAREAGLLVYNPEGAPTKLEKFAELIVRECMRQVEEQYKPVLEDEVMMNEAHWKGYLHCGVDSVVAIKDHFGVEE